MTAKQQKRFGTGIRSLEELEPRTMLAGHGFDGSFAEARGAFFAAAQTAQAFSVAPLSQAFHQEYSFFSEFAASRAVASGNWGSYDDGDGDSSSSSLTAALSDGNGNTATITYQTGKLLGTAESVFTVTGDTLDEGNSITLSVNGTPVGNVAIDSTGSGTLIVPTSSLSTTVAATSTVVLGTMNGTFAASTSTTSGNGGSGCGGGESSSGSSLTASVTDSAGDTATVTYQTGKLLGTAESVITVTGDTLDEGNSVALSINGTPVGNIAISSTGSGTLIVPTSNLSTTVAATGTITLGTLSGTFAAATSTSSGDGGHSGCGSSPGTSLTASATDTNGDTATVTYQTGKLLGTAESVITVTGDTVDEGTSVAVAISGAPVGSVAINSSGTGTLTVPTSSLSTTVAAGSTVTVGNFSGTFAAAASSDQSAHGTFALARHHGRR